MSRNGVMILTVIVAVALVLWYFNRGGATWLPMAAINRNRGQAGGP